MWRPEPPPKQIIASGSSRASIALGARSFACGHSHPRPRGLPFAVVAAADADAPVRELGDGRPVAAREDAAALALGMALQGAPFLEGENSVIVLAAAAGEPFFETLDRARALVPWRRAGRPSRPRGQVSSASAAAQRGRQCAGAVRRWEGAAGSEMAPAATGSILTGLIAPRSGPRMRPKRSGRKPLRAWRSRAAGGSLIALSARLTASSPCSTACRSDIVADIVRSRPCADSH